MFNYFISLVILFSLSCQRQTNEIADDILRCGPSVVPEGSYTQILSPKGTPLSGKEVKAKLYTDSNISGETLAVTEKGCVRTDTLASGWLVVNRPESSWSWKSKAESLEAKSITLEVKRASTLKLECPSSLKIGPQVDLQEVFGIPLDETSLSYQLVQDPQRQLSGYGIAEKSIKLQLNSTFQEDLGLELQVEVNDLVTLGRSQIKCPVTFDSSAPTADARLPKWAEEESLNINNKEVIKIDPNSNITLVSGDSDSQTIEYCFTPVNYQELISEDKPRECQEPETYQGGIRSNRESNSGYWQLTYRSIDDVGNVSSWSDPQYLLYYDLDKIKRIRAEASSEIRLNQETVGFESSLKNMFHAIDLYSERNSLVTQAEKEQVDFAVLKSLYESRSSDVLLVDELDVVARLAQFVGKYFIFRKGLEKLVIYNTENPSESLEFDVSGESGSDQISNITQYDDRSVIVIAGKSLYRWSEESGLVLLRNDLTGDTISGGSLTVNDEWIAYYSYELRNQAANQFVFIPRDDISKDITEPVSCVGQALQLTDDDKLYFGTSDRCSSESSLATGLRSLTIGVPGVSQVFETNFIRSISYDAEKKLLAFISNETLGIIDTKTDAILGRKAVADSLGQVGFLENGRSLAYKEGSSIKIVRLDFNLQPDEILDGGLVISSGTSASSLRTDGSSRLSTSFTGRNTSYIWSLKDWNEEFLEIVRFDEGAKLHTVEFDDPMKELVVSYSVGGDRYIGIYDISGRLKNSYSTGSQYLNFFASYKGTIVGGYKSIAGFDQDGNPIDFGAFAYKKQISGVIVDSFGRFIVSSYDGSVDRWTILNGAAKREPIHYDSSDYISQISLSSDEKLLAVTGWITGFSRIIDLDSGAVSTKISHDAKTLNFVGQSKQLSGISKDLSHFYTGDSQALMHDFRLSDAGSPQLVGFWMPSNTKGWLLSPTLGTKDGKQFGFVSLWDANFDDFMETSVQHKTHFRGAKLGNPNIGVNNGNVRATFAGHDKVSFFKDNVLYLWDLNLENQLMKTCGLVENVLKKEEHEALSKICVSMSN
ncbi:WD40 repeat domain-containing protein [Pseudobacteriovorax antillogorgiicola]|uniref:Uncharacterized protein n=1 Tax=Pseudobacteriovorax antillogorgiicola TaxID=1513793 RepID=A0A1Y6C9Q5_9BACT|nr:WD40 repeat domain-containing protein [Pseudobacteriovorax antillogorgiicola]TCS48997.1 hypothetical protein EDD56_11639 [Pseudobacteriovorax antillogorgiicola]SMF53305.1 hypothetical protein SAMN06296036_116115 [Pseudobacteriovorax antillogorgiicola]